MAIINFGGIKENVITKDEFPLEKAQRVLQNEIISVIGYGIQGPGQALNLRDNGFNIIIGQRKLSSSYERALQDGWIENKTLFSIEKALQKSNYHYVLAF